MRSSIAQLADTPVRLADLRFPATRVHVHRTRLAYIHLDNLLHFAKIDRDGRIDGFIVAYLPDEVAILFLRGGDVVTAVAMTERGREVLPIATVLQRMQDELERGELAYCEAPIEQLRWMYSSCAAPAAMRPVQNNEPWLLFKALQHEQYTGVLELISNGRVTYIRFKEGKFRDGHFCDKQEGLSVSRFVEGLMVPGAEGQPPGLAAAVFAAGEELPEQAPATLIATYHDLFWRIAEAAEREAKGEAVKRAVKLRDSLGKVHRPLLHIGAERDSEPEPMVVAPQALTYGLADWTGQLLEELEVIAPGIAPAVLRDATREHRFVLQKAGFYERLPWTVDW